jgi:archaellum component FlaC
MADESIYSLIPERIVAPPKQALYKSRFNEAPTIGKKPAATFGQPHTSVDSKHYLKRGQSQVPMLRNPQAVGVDKRDTRPVKAPVPSRDDKPVMGLVSQKNFVTANAVDNILAVPKKPVSNEINYLNKADYGQVPGYLDRVKTQIQEEYMMIEELQKSSQPQNENAIEMLTDMEREDLLTGLKTNWERVNKEYQTLSFTLDTASKKQRKEAYESQLEQIENDIKRLTRKFVFINHD